MGIKTVVRCQVFLKVDGEPYRAEYQRELVLPGVPDIAHVLWGALTNVPAGLNPIDEGSEKFSLVVTSVVLHSEADLLSISAVPMKQRPCSCNEAQRIMNVISGQPCCRPLEFFDDEWVGKHFSRASWQRVGFKALKPAAAANVPEGVDEGDDDDD